MLSSDNAVIFACAARCLYMRNEEKGKEIFHKMLQDGNKDTRRFFLKIFSKIKDAYITEEFQNAIEREDRHDLMLEFADQIPDLTETEGIKKAINEEMESEDPHRRWYAIKTSSRLKTSWSAERLKDALKTEPDRALKTLIRRAVPGK